MHSVQSLQFVNLTKIEQLYLQPMTGYRKSRENDGKLNFFFASGHIPEALRQNTFMGDHYQSIVFKDSTIRYEAQI